MAESNFYSYLFAQNGKVSFDELAEVIDFSDPDTIQKAFIAYLEDYRPPYDLSESLCEEKFHSEEPREKKDKERVVKYEIAIPGLEEDVDEEVLKTYIEEFIEKIGCDDNPEVSPIVEVNSMDNERGGVDVDIYIAIKYNDIVSQG